MLRVREVFGVRDVLRVLDLWEGPVDIEAAFASADFLADNRVVLGNKYRLVAHVKYGPLFLVYIRFVGTHASHDKIDATTI